MFCPLLNSMPAAISKLGFYSAYICPYKLSTLFNVMCLLLQQFPNRHTTVKQRRHNVGRHHDVTSTLIWHWRHVPAVTTVTQQAQNLKKRRINVDATSWHRIDVDTPLFLRHVLAGFSLITQSFCWRQPVPWFDTFSSCIGSCILLSVDIVHCFYVLLFFQRWIVFSLAPS